MKEAASGGDTPLVLQRRWLGLSSVGILIFALVWNAFVLLYAAQTLQAEGLPEEALLIIPGLIVGVIAAYLALAVALNRTTLTVSRQTIEARHGPIPWPGRAFETAQVRQVFVRRYGSGPNQRRRASFSLLLTLEDGRSKRLLQSLPGSTALELKNAIQQHLSLDTQPVEGEYRGW